jgi:hypothetical protein
MATTERYEYWVHQPTGKFYAVRLQNNRVVGVCGPLGLELLGAPTELSTVEYRDTDGIERYRAEFVPAPIWLRGQR